jgi:RNA-directed DNA polymerase
MTPEGQRLMEAVVERGNLWLAYQRVVENKGAPGVDGLTVAEFKAYLKVHWPRIRAALLEGRYIPQPVRAVDIAKPSGGVRTLGIPTLVDRLIQQALNQVLSPIFEPGFSEASYGFRPGRSALQAVRVAQAHVQAGRDCGWWTLTWRGSSTGSTTICSSHGWRGALAMSGCSSW